MDKHSPPLVSIPIVPGKVCLVRVFTPIFFFFSLLHLRGKSIQFVGGLSSAYADCHSSTRVELDAFELKISYGSAHVSKQLFFAVPEEPVH